MMSPLPHGKQTNTYVPEAAALVMGRQNNKRSGSLQQQHSLIQQQLVQVQQHKDDLYGNAEFMEMAAALPPKPTNKSQRRRNKKHVSQPSSEPQSDDSGSERVEEESEIATLGRVERSRPGNT
jgi:hypothetical protein